MHILRLCQAREVGAQDIQFIKLEFIEFPLNSFGDVMSLLCLSCAAGCVWGLCVQQGINAVVWVCCSYLEKLQEHEGDVETFTFGKRPGTVNQSK